MDLNKPLAIHDSAARAIALAIIIILYNYVLYSPNYSQSVQLLHLQVLVITIFTVVNIINFILRMFVYVPTLFEMHE